MNPTLIGVLIGAAATLSASFLQLWFNTCQRERERYMQLRRDAYFESADGLASGLAYLSQFSRTDTPITIDAPPSTAWFYKLHLVASTDTLIAFSEAGGTLAAAMVDIMVKRVSIKEVDDEIEIVKNNLAQMQQLQTDIKAEARGSNQATPSPEMLHRLERLKQQLDDSWAQITHENAKLEYLVREHARRTREHLEQVTTLAAAFQKTARTAFLAARRELGLTIDEARFAAAARSVDDRMTKKMSEIASLITTIGDGGSIEPIGPVGSGNKL